MIYTYKLNELQLLHAIFIPDHQFQKYFYVSLGNNFVYFFCGGPLVVEAPGKLPSSPPKSGPVPEQTLGQLAVAYDNWGDDVKAYYFLGKLGKPTVKGCGKSADVCHVLRSNV